MNATTVAVDLAKNVLEHYSPSWLAPAAAELKMNALDATTVTEHEIAAGRARELNGPPGRCICPGLSLLPSRQRLPDVHSLLRPCLSCPANLALTLNSRPPRPSLPRDPNSRQSETSLIVWRKYPAACSSSTIDLSPAFFWSI